MASSLGDLFAPVDRAAALPAWARRIGVTRVARVTGLDRCGVEVACAIRPAGHILQVSNGKGASFARAKEAALSEALELWAAENVDPARVEWAREEPGAAFWPAAFLAPGAASPQPSGPQPWARARRLDVAKSVFVPAALVWCPKAGALPLGMRTAAWTANGMAAHPDPTLARWHALFEVLEREALCRVLPDGWTPEHLRMRGVRFEHPLVDALEERGLRVHCVDATPAGWPIPVMAVLVVDRDSRAPKLAAGYACRRTAADAAEAAFFEACQSRLTEIHGAREDVTQTSSEIPDWVLAAKTARRDLGALPSWPGSMRGLVRALGVAAAAVDLSVPGIPRAVTRVFVPGFRLPEYLT